jgi:hypothetical protein
MLRKLLLGHQKFIFVPSEINDEAVVTIANCLQPLQYVVLRKTKDIIEGYIAGSTYQAATIAEIADHESLGERYVGPWHRSPLLRQRIWVGGPVPLGYAAIDKKVMAEAETVRALFTRYLELGSVRALAEDLKARGIRTRQRQQMRWIAFVDRPPVSIAFSGAEARGPAGAAAAEV